MILTVGLGALGLLAADATSRTATTSEQVRSMVEVSDRWDEFFLEVGVEYEALSDYMRATSAEGRTPLRSALGGAAPTLAWLREHGTAADRTRSTSIAATYQTYTESLRQVMIAHDNSDTAATALLADQASLSAAALRKQAVSAAADKRAELNLYLTDVERGSASTRLATTVIGALDALLLAGCALILLGYQRRTERQASNSTFRAFHDDLTGLPNRAFLLDRLNTAMNGGVGEHEPSVLLLLDLDGFKDINDGLGHDMGDRLLQEISQRLLLLNGGRGEAVARLGGDEFAVLLTGSSLDRGLAKARKIDAAVRLPVRLDGLATSVGCSIGLAIHPDHASNSTELLKNADIAMYDAKRRRLGVSVFSVEANQNTPERLVLLSQLRHALESGQELVLHYQPKVHAQLGTVCGVEALLRWQHPTRGLLGPPSFIAEAERSDLMTALTDHVLSMACHQLASWLAADLRLPMSVNVGATELTDDRFPRRVADVLACHGVPPGLVTLEITETALVADDLSTRTALGRLHTLGVRLSLDDFGTGYSSLSHLTMPLDELKIDRTFVTDMTMSPQSHAIARAVVDVAHALGLRVVGEGVEDSDTLEALRVLGCDEVQGYRLCRPLPVDELRVWLETVSATPSRQSRLHEVDDELV